MWCIKTYTIAYVKIQQMEIYKPNLQPNLCLKVDFQKLTSKQAASG